MNTSRALLLLVLTPALVFVLATLGQYNDDDVKSDYLTWHLYKICTRFL